MLISNNTVQQSGGPLLESKTTNLVHILHFYSTFFVTASAKIVVVTTQTTWTYTVKNWTHQGPKDENGINWALTMAFISKNSEIF